MIEREPINESLFLITDLSYVAIVNQDDVNDVNDERERERERENCQWLTRLIKSLAARTPRWSKAT